MKTSLIQRLQLRVDIRVGIIGTGYIGLPLAVRLAQRGLSVTGIDTEIKVVEKLKSGVSTIEGIESESLREVSTRLDFIALSKDNPAQTPVRILKKLMGTDVFVICVPTPLDKTKRCEPDTRYIRQAEKMLSRLIALEGAAGKLPTERLIVLESTTYPGTTNEIFVDIVKRAARKKSYLAYSPERTNPGPDAYKDKRGQLAGSADSEIPGAFQVTKIVGGQDTESCDTAKAFYEIAFDTVRTVTNMETAELVKLVENTFRFISIAFANEMGRVARAFDLDIWEVISAARTKRFGFGLTYPGLIGGHCLPIDPLYLNAAIRNRRLASTFVDVAESEHQNVKREAFDLVQRLLNQRNKGISKSSIIFFGVSYKQEVGDVRESPALYLMQRLFMAGANVSFWDPVRQNNPAKPQIKLMFSPEQHRDLPRQQAERLTLEPSTQKYFLTPAEIVGPTWRDVRQQVLEGKFSCVVIATNHQQFKAAYADLLQSRFPAIADLCNAVRRWLNKVELNAKAKSNLQKKLTDRKKYMLIWRS